MKATQFRKIIFLSLSIFTVLQSTCFAVVSAKKSVKEANRLYQKGKLDEALQKYYEASLEMPDSDIINFNMGVVLYKKEDYPKAIDAFTKALTSEDRGIEADALYNLGNCKYKLGKLKENTDLASAVNLLRESLDYYKRTIEIDPKSKDARFSYGFVERELKVLLDKLKTQPKGKQQGKQGQGEEQQQGQGASSVEKEQGQQREEESGQTQEQQQQDKEKEDRGALKQDEKQKEEAQATKEEAQQEEQGKELSEEAARAILERYGRDEATPDYMDRRIRGYDREVLKDW